MNVKKAKIRSGTVCIVKAIHFGGTYLGNGWFFTCEHGVMDRPVLIDLEGNSMDEGWYNIIIVDTILAVSSDRIQ